MKDEPKCLEMDHLEQGTLINALNQMRTDQLEQGRPTDAVDDLLLEIMEDPPAMPEAKPIYPQPTIVVDPPRQGV